MKLYFKYLLVLLKAQMQYRVSFILLSLGQFLAPLFLFIGMYFMFDKFGNVKGWTFFEVAICFAIINISFSISECFVRGFDAFSKLIIKGDFDRILVRPRGTIVQVLGSNFEFSRIGRIIQGTMVLVWAMIKVNIEWDVLKIAMIILMITSGIFIFSGIFIIVATMSFFTIQGLEAMNILTNGGREISQYPLNIYKDWVVKFFTYVIPFASVNYLPLMYLLGKHSGGMAYILSPLAGVLFIIPCVFIWKFGVRHYMSTGS